ncbi:hypothetical protein, partial [Armatimonas sp.]|uniref:hypothetical protein n=1 Tax=Armatimonas sp. TaxID=1872638 RepID=UPI00286D34BC
MEEQKDKVAKVAVVVIHGVASQTPAHNPRMVTKLLQGLTFRDFEGREQNDFPKQDTVAERPQRKRYSGWTEETFQIAAQPENSDLSDPENASEDLKFTRKLLKGYKPPSQDGIYSTTKFSGKRLFGNREQGSGETPVDVYEVYWSDLSSIGNQLTRILTGFYSLLFHLTELGRLTLAHAGKSLEGIYTLHATLGWLLGRVLPLLFLPVVLLLIGQILLAFETTAQRVFLALIPAVAGLACAILLLIKRTTRWALLLSLLGIVVGVLLFQPWLQTPRWLGEGIPPEFASWQRYWGQWLLGAWLLISTGSLIVLPKKLQDYAPSLRSLINWEETNENTSWDKWAPPLMALVCLGLGWLVFQGTLPSITLEQAPARVLFHVSLFCYHGWLVGLMIVAVLLLVNGVCLAIKGKTAIKARGTALITSVIPFALSMWAGNALLALGAKLIFLSCHLNLTSQTLQSLMVEKRDSLPKLELLRKIARAADYIFAPPELGIVAVIVLGVFSLIVVLALLPSIVTEGSAPRSGKASMESQGRWLSWGYKCLWGALALLLIAAAMEWGASFYITKVLVPPAQHICDSLISNGGVTSKDQHDALNSSIVIGSTGALLVLGFLFQGKRVAQVLGSIVGVAIDVDNHLRDLPADRTPRARIFNRYVSLLRYLAREDYSKIVIVAHSQGSVITADLLRYLKATSPSQHSALSHLPPIRLFTMGSPLRQLYQLRFPTLYKWVTERNDGPDS